MSEQLTLWSEAHLAKASQSRVSEMEWMTRVETWPSHFLHLLIEFSPASWSTRTSPACCRLTEEGRLEPCSGGWKNSGTAWRGEYWTLSTSEWNHILAPSPSDAGVCSLSDILETGDLPRRYCLSDLACRGILRRAEKRGKSLPRFLHAALLGVGSDPTSIAMGD